MCVELAPSSRVLLELRLAPFTLNANARVGFVGTECALAGTDLLLYFRAIRLQHHGHAGYGNRLRHLPKLEDRIHTVYRIDGHSDIRPYDGLKTRRRHFNVVNAGLQVGDLITTGCVRLRFADAASLLVSCSHGDVGYGTAALVDDATG